MLYLIHKGSLVGRVGFFTKGMAQFPSVTSLKLGTMKIDKGGKHYG